MQFKSTILVLGFLGIQAGVYRRPMARSTPPALAGTYLLKVRLQSRNKINNDTFYMFFETFVKIQEVVEQARGNAQQPSAFQVKARHGD